MTIGGIGLGVLIAVMGAILVHLGWRERATIRALRAAIFDACLPCFEDYRLTQDSVDFPVLDGHLRGRRVLLEPVVDAVTVRKLPVLWLRVTLLEPLPMGAALSLLVRPQGTEFWSPSAELRHRLPIPAGWPEHALLRSDQPDVAHLLSKLSPHVEAFFSEVQAKEIAVSPRGVRLVYQLDQARRSNYLVLRTALFDRGSLAPALLSTLAERTFAIHQALGGAGVCVLHTAHAL